MELLDVYFVVIVFSAHGKEKLRVNTVNFNYVLEGWSRDLSG